MNIVFTMHWVSPRGFRVRPPNLLDEGSKYECKVYFNQSVTSRHLGTDIDN